MNYAICYEFKGCTQIVVDDSLRLHIYNNREVAYNIVPKIISSINNQLNAEYFSILGSGNNLSDERVARFVAIKNTIHVLECVVDKPRKYNEQ